MTRLISPLGRVTIGGTDIFQSGDGILKSVSLELGEDKRASRCQFVVYDPDLLIGAKYQAMSLSEGGIITPEGLLSDKESSLPVSPGNSSPDPSNVTTSGSSTQNAALKPEVRAFLDVISYSEGADYNVMFTGRRFSSYADHPRIRNRSGGLVSDAAGRYQFLSTTWDGVKKKLSLKNFSPASQDLGAVELIRNRGALPDVEKGSAGLRSAIIKCNKEWASFPGSPYGQPTRTLEQLEQVYVKSLLKYQKQSPSQTAATIQPQVKDKTESKILQDKAATKPQEKSVKGTEIIIELGFSLDQLVAYHFIHIATTTSRESLGTTTFEGQSVRWLLTRRLQNTAYTNITLRQLAQKVCDRYGLKLLMEGNGPTYQHLDQTGISDYELLLREGYSIGYSIKEEKNALILKPYRPNFRGLVITRDILQSIRFTDRASSDRSPTPGATASTPAIPAAQTKTKHDRKTGQVAQTRTEDSTGTGSKNSKPAGVTGTATPSVHGTTIPDSSVTGLPKQEIGAIDLADGKAEAQEIADEAKRIKGYESQASLITTPEALTIAPGSIIAVSDEVAPDPFCREWRVSSIRHSLEAGRLRSELSFYSPQAQKDSTATPTTSNTTTTSSTTTTLDMLGGFVLPMKGVTGEGLGRRSPSRYHYGVDIAAQLGTPVIASADGVCTVLSNPGGYGTYVTIQHSNNILTIYGHLSNVSVTTGQQVKQGQQIGKCGSTGRSTGPHLHWQIMKGGMRGQAIAPSEIGVTIPPQHRSGFRY